MRSWNRNAAISLILAGAATAAAPLSTPIGLVVAKGSFQLDNHVVWSNGTLFDGNTISTGKASSRLRLGSGAQMRVASESRVQVYRGHAVLEEGAGQFEAFAGYPIKVGNLHISSPVPSTIARVQMKEGREICISVVSGAVHVANAMGIPLANLSAGHALSFTPQDAGPAAPSDLAGCLTRAAGAYFLADETSNIIAELRGEGLETGIGQKIRITGSTAASQGNASPVVHVTGIRKLTGKCGEPDRGGQGHTSSLGGLMIAAAEGITIDFIAEEESKPETGR